MSREGQHLEVESCEATGVIAEDSFVTLDTAYTGAGIGVKQAGAGDPIYGVAVDPATAAGQTIQVAVEGAGKLLKLGATPGTIAPGDHVKSDASGFGVKTTTARDEAIIALGAGDTEGNYIPVKIVQYLRVKAAS